MEIIECYPKFRSRRISPHSTEHSQAAANMRHRTRSTLNLNTWKCLPTARSEKHLLKRGRFIFQRIPQSANVTAACVGRRGSCFDVFCCEWTPAHVLFVALFTQMMQMGKAGRQSRSSEEAVVPCNPKKLLRVSETLNRRNVLRKLI